MSDPITTSFADFETSVKWAKALLESSGYTVIDPRPVWITTGTFAKEMGLSISGMSRLLNRCDCPEYPKRVTLTGRITSLFQTQQLRDFVNQHKRKSP